MAIIILKHNLLIPTKKLLSDFSGYLAAILRSINIYIWWCEDESEEVAEILLVVYIVRYGKN